jgi:hypothetical protein
VDKFWMVGSQKEKLIRESENENEPAVVGLAPATGVSV